MTSSLITIPAALMILQFWLMVVFFVGIAILARGYNPTHGIRVQVSLNPSGHYFVIILFLLMTVAPLFFTGKFSEIWGPTFGTAGANVFDISDVKLWIFLVDIGVAAAMIVRVLGWKASPFTAVMFSIPAFAILLHESASRVAIYTLIIALLYGLGLWYEWSNEGGRVTYRDRIETQVSLWVVAVLMLVLTTIIGWLTRAPVP